MDNREYLNKVAQQWDRMRESFFSEAVRDKAVGIAEVQPGKLAADIGSGTGFITEALVQKGLRVIAVDQSELMLMEMKLKWIVRVRTAVPNPSVEMNMPALVYLWHRV